MLNLHEVIELEKKWQIYKEKQNKNKKIMFYICGACCFLFAIVFVIYYFYNKGATQLQNNVAQSNKEIKNLVNEKKVELEKSKILNKNKQRQNETNQQNINKVDESMNSELVVKQDKILNIDTKMPSLSIQSIATNTRTFAIDENKKKIISNNPVEKMDNIVITDIKTSNVDNVRNVDNLEYMLIKYNETNSIYFALDIAETYYNKSDFINARKWALTANKQDYSNEKSWILFAKSSYKLGYKEQAIDSLKSYLKNKDSKNIRELLDNIMKDQI